MGGSLTYNGFPLFSPTNLTFAFPELRDRGTVRFRFF